MNTQDNIAPKRVRHLTAQAGGDLENVRINLGETAHLPPDERQLAAEVILRNKRIEHAFKLHVGYQTTHYTDPHGATGYTMSVTLPEHLSLPELQEHIELLTSQRDEMNEQNRTARLESRSGFSADRKAALAQVRSLQEHAQPVLQLADSLKAGASVQVRNALENLWSTVNESMYSSATVTAHYPPAPASLELALSELTAERNKRASVAAARNAELREMMREAGIGL